MPCEHQHQALKEHIHIEAGLK